MHVLQSVFFFSTSAPPSRSRANRYICLLLSRVICIIGETQLALLFCIDRFWRGQLHMESHDKLRTTAACGSPRVMRREWGPIAARGSQCPLAAHVAHLISFPWGRSKINVNYSSNLSNAYYQESR